MKKSTLIWTIVVIIVLVVIVIIVSNSNSSSTATTQAPNIPATTTPAGTVVLNTGTNSTIGTFLVATNGMTLYQSAADTSGVSNCTGSCATAWPPYTVSSASSLVGGAGVDGAISTITRADGTMQVTYNGMPLYFFQSDKTSGDATGQNVNGFTVVTP